MSGRHRLVFAVAWATACGVTGCDGAPTAPTQPTWAEVAPILRGECGHCHGSTAVTTGLSYRLDFYEDDTCGDAKAALVSPVTQQRNVILAGDPETATKIRDDVSIPPGGGRPRMPPAPGPVLYDWERQTLQRWANQPVKGPPPTGNRPPTIQVNGMPSIVDAKLGFVSLLEDPDDDPVIGVIEVDGVPRYGMNRTGTFAVALDTSAWPNGNDRVTAVLCDGWTSVTVDLGPVIVEHPTGP